MVGFIFDIIFTVFAELYVILALLVLWLIAFPIGCILAAPVVLISAAFGSRPFGEVVRGFYSAMVELWLSMSPRWRPWRGYD